jgi:hypothetical protein
MILTILSHLEVVAEIDGVGNHVVRPGSEVHVADGTAGQHQTCDHFGQVVRSDTITEA